MARGKKRARQLKMLSDSEKAELKEALLSGTIRGMDAFELYNISTYLYWQQLATELGIRYEKAPSGKRTEGTYIAASAQDIAEAQQAMAKLMAKSNRNGRHGTQRLRRIRTEAAEQQRAQEREEAVEAPSVIQEDVAVVEVHNEVPAEVVELSDEDDDTQRTLALLQDAANALVEANERLQAMTVELSEAIAQRDTAIAQRVTVEQEYQQMLGMVQTMQRDFDAYKRSHQELIKIRNREKLQQVEISRQKLAEMVKSTRDFVDKSRQTGVLAPPATGATVKLNAGDGAGVTAE